MEPSEALAEVVDLLSRRRDGGYRARAFSQAAKAIRGMSHAELEELMATNRLRALPGIGDSTGKVIIESLRGGVPHYLLQLRTDAVDDMATPEGALLQQALRGDLHLHSDWSDGGDTIRAMVDKARAIGHDYIALTDHSPRLKVAHGLDRDRLVAQLDEVRAINDEVAPFRLLTGIETDILDDGALDGDPELLKRLDVVVASVHSQLRMDGKEMTRRMVGAVANPLADILGHCTGRMVTGRGRPESSFDVDVVFAACKQFDKAVEINCRPERLDPPKRMLRRVVEMGVKVSVDTDAHATSQLGWQFYGCNRAVECGVPPESIVNSWSLDDLIDWCASHETAPAA
ncbi:MAG TPA: PHP domain-containing protein [Acidimicrobiia bacterium]